MVCILHGCRFECGQYGDKIDRSLVDVYRIFICITRPHKIRTPTRQLKKKNKKTPGVLFAHLIHREAA